MLKSEYIVFAAFLLVNVLLALNCITLAVKEAIYKNENDLSLSEALQADLKTSNPDEQSDKSHPLIISDLYMTIVTKNQLQLDYSWNFFTQSPKNFVLGAGVRQFFRKIQKPYYDVKKMERLIYPHNIVFNFWSEIGFFGMTSFMALLGYALYRAWHILKTDRLWGATLIAIVAVP
jgi:hypothetical protein